MAGRLWELLQRAFSKVNSKLLNSTQRKVSLLRWTETTRFQIHSPSLILMIKPGELVISVRLLPYQRQISSLCTFLSISKTNLEVKWCLLMTTRNSTHKRKFFKNLCKFSLKQETMSQSSKGSNLWTESQLITLRPSKSSEETLQSYLERCSGAIHLSTICQIFLW